VKRQVLLQFMEFRNRGDLQGAASLLDPTIRGEEGIHQQRYALHTLALFALAEGNFDQALTYCFKLTEINISDPYIHQLMGVIYRLKGELLQAEKELRLSLTLTSIDSISDNRFVCTTELGRTLLAANRLDECEELCTSDWNPSDQIDLNALGKGECVNICNRVLLLAKLYFKQRKYSEAIEFYRRVIRVRHSNRELKIGGEELIEELASAIRQLEEKH